MRFKYGRLLRKYKKALVVLATFGVIGACSEYFAIKWGAWAYSPDHVTGIKFLAMAETFLLSEAIILSVGSVTIVGAHVIDKQTAKSRKRQKLLFVGVHPGTMVKRHGRLVAKHR